MLNTILNLLYALAALSTIHVILFPRQTLYHWWYRRKLPHFKTAASLLEYLERVGPLYNEFEYDKREKTFHYAAERIQCVFTQEFTTTTELRDTILSKLEANQKPWHNLNLYTSYQVDDLLPLARIDKLKLLVS